MIGVNYFWTRHENLVYKECRAYQRKFGGEFEDILSDAYLGFVKCLENWEPNRGAFSTLLTICVRHALADRKPHHKFEELPEIEYRTSFWEQLSEDANLIIRAVLPIRKGKKRLKRRIEALTHLGLSGDRIASAVREIKEVLAT